MAGTYHVAQKAPQASDANSGTEEAPWKTISKAAAELAPGDTVVIHEGVYREWVNPARSGSASAPIVFQSAASESVILTGADVISGWVRSEGHIWKKELWQHRFATHPNDDRHRLVGRCEQLIVDGRLLKQVERFKDLVAGSFCADTNEQVLYLWLPGGEDPGGHVVEAAVRSVCFGPGWGQEPRHHIVLRGVTIRYAANMAHAAPCSLQETVGSLRTVGWSGPTAQAFLFAATM